MRTLSIDLETFSGVPLPKCGVYKYAESPDFEILLFAYAFDDDPVTVIDIAQGQSISSNVLLALSDSGILKTAFNAAFEITCLNAYFQNVHYLDISQWRCTAVMASELGLPRHLDKVGEVIGLSADKQKLKSGKALIRYFSIPCKPTKANGGRTRNLPHHDIDKWKLFIEYNRQDVEAERAVRKRLLRFDIDSDEQSLWVIDQEINRRGVKADITLAENAVIIDDIVKERLTEQAKELTRLDNPKSAAQIKAWIEDTAGEQVESLRKDKIQNIKESINNDVNAMLDIRAGLSRTSTGKYNAILRTACKDDRIRGLTQFYGANRTGRWAGRLVQMQNLVQNRMPLSDLDTARRLVMEGDMDTLELLYDDIADTLTQLIRTAFIPEKGCKFIAADFSAIEARVIAWLAGEKWRMDVFNSHGKIYEASAEQMFRLPAGSIKKGDPMRQKGKIAELALGYGGSICALTAMGALNMGLEESELRPLVNSWRLANPAIVKFWWDVDKAMRRTIVTGAVTILTNENIFCKLSRTLPPPFATGNGVFIYRDQVIE
jgi:DNA polymerase